MSTEAPVAHQFENAAQQREAATLGMWIFLATEVLFFGALFLGYTVYRLRYPQVFHAASQHTLVLIGAINTAILIVSSFIMVLAVRAAEMKSRASAWLLLGTASLGVAFLVLKGFEYHHEIQEGLFPGAAFHLEGVDPEHGRMFFDLYFLLTGVHALHVFIGIVLLTLFAARIRWSARPAQLATSVELLGLYWHFVDLVWVFLFPLLYLASRAR